VDLDASQDDIWQLVEPLVEQAERQYERAIVSRLIDAVRADALGVADYAATRAALEAGQVDILVIADNAPLAPVARSELVALAARTDAQVEIVALDPTLDALGGVGALLRYRTREQATLEVTGAGR
jgi:peptide subunit release factor 1 (eRF1)